VGSFKEQGDGTIPLRQIPRPARGCTYLVEEHGLTYKLEDDAWRYMIDRNIGFFPRKEAIALNWSTDTISLKSKRK
jgi:hypothetical protein